MNDHWPPTSTTIQSVTFRFRNFSVSKLFHLFGGFGFGIEKIWFRKKDRIRYKKLGIEKSIGFGIGKQFWIRFRSHFRYRHTLITFSNIWMFNTSSFKIWQIFVENLWNFVVVKVDHFKPGFHNFPIVHWLLDVVIAIFRVV